MQKSIFTLLAGLLLSFQISFSQEVDCYLHDPNSGPREHAVDLQSMILELDFEPEAGIVKGIITYQFIPLQKAVTEMFFDAPGIEIKEVEVDMGNAKSSFETNEEGIFIRTEKPLTWGTYHQIKIKYSATPKKGIYFVGWDDPTGKSRKQIWTQGQGVDNRYWIPSFDDPADKLVTELKVTFDDKYKVLSNGRLVNEKSLGGGKKEWHYKLSNPHANYLVMLGIGDYAVKESVTKTGIPMKLYYYPDQPDKFWPTYRYSGEILDILEEETGVKYPWESYSQIPVQEFLYGAMENTTATIFGDFFYVDKRAYNDRNYVGVNAHEAAHQWFGDLITQRTQKDIWLHESFATHYSKVVLGRIFGEEYHQKARWSEMQSALSASENETKPIMYSKAGTARIYPKGSVVLDMMKHVVGKEQFDTVVARYLRKFAFQNVTTNDFYLAFHDVLGVNLDWFFEQWVYRGGEPHYQVEWSKITVDGKNQARVIVEQVHDVSGRLNYFKMPVDFEIYYKDGSSKTVRETIEKKVEIIDIPLDQKKEVEFIVFDKANMILKRLDYKRPIKEVIAQASGANMMIDRYVALLELRDTETDEKREALTALYKKEKYHFVRQEIVRQLSKDENKDSRKLLASAFNDKDVEVRRAAIENIDLTEENRKYFEGALRDSSYQNAETALNKLISKYPEKGEEYLKEVGKDLKPGYGGIGNHLFIRMHELSAQRGSKGSLQTLVGLTGLSHEFRTRINAMEALKRLNYLNEELIVNLVQANLHFNSRLRGPAREVLKYYYQQNSYREKIDNYLEDRDLLEELKL